MPEVKGHTFTWEATLRRPVGTAAGAVVETSYELALARILRWLKVPEHRVKIITIERVK